MKFEYYVNKKIKKIDIKKVSQFSTGLMFRKTSPTLLFDLGREKAFSITSIFCKPFRVILLDKNKNKKKSFDVLKKRWSIRCFGRYLIEVPLNNLNSDEKSKGLNRKSSMDN